MFRNVQPAPPDPILGLSEAFKTDPHPDKINLGVGVYQDNQGVTPTLECVKEAERRLIAREMTKSYLSMEGLPKYGQHVQQLLFGDSKVIGDPSRARTVQSPGGTGALRVAADLIKKVFPTKRIWLSTPTWANHSNVFRAADVATESYPYFDADLSRLDIDGMLSGLADVPSGQVVLLHACCHNPTGIDPTIDQWRQIGTVLAQRDHLPLVDFAYQGFGDGLHDDAAGLVALMETVPELLVCSSFSKNFGLYRERVGALTILAGTVEAAENIISQAKACVRANYSNPPAHGAAIVETILSDAELRSGWEQELKGMRDRVNGMRKLFVATMKAKGAERDYSFIQEQRGMFSFSGMSAKQVDELREKFSIYIVRSGRINVAGMTPANMDRLCEAIVSVL